MTDILTVNIIFYVLLKKSVELVTFLIRFSLVDSKTNGTANIKLKGGRFIESEDSRLFFFGKSQNLQSHD